MSDKFPDKIDFYNERGQHIGEARRDYGAEFEDRVATAAGGGLVFVAILLVLAIIFFPIALLVLIFKALANRGADPTRTPMSKENKVLLAILLLVLCLGVVLSANASASKPFRPSNLWFPTPSNTEIEDYLRYASNLNVGNDGYIYEFSWIETPQQRARQHFDSLWGWPSGWVSARISDKNGNLLRQGKWYVVLQDRHSVIDLDRVVHSRGWCFCQWQGEQDAKIVEGKAGVVPTATPQSRNIAEQRANPPPNSPDGDSTTPLVERPIEVSAHIDLQTYDFIYVQSGPSITGSEVSRIADPTVLFRALSLSQDGQWVYVRLGDNKEGWIMRKFVVSDEPLDKLPIGLDKGRIPPPVVQRSSEVSAHIDLQTYDFIYVRSGPSVNASEVGRIDNSTVQFKALGLSQDSQWVYARFDDNKEGWIMRKFVVGDEPLDKLPRR